MKFNKIHVEYIAGLDNVSLARTLSDHPPPVMTQIHPRFTCRTTPYLSPDNIHRRAATQAADTTTSASDNSLLCLVVAATIIIDKN